MSQTNINQNQQATAQPSGIKFPEQWEWEGEQLMLAYNPYDPSRSQLRPDYSRLVGERGVCQPVLFRNRTNNEEIRKFAVLAKVKAPPEPGSLVPEKTYYCFRLYDMYIDPRLVDWSSLVFYEIRPKDKAIDTSLNESQRFMNSLLGGQESAQQAAQAHDNQWAREFEQIQRQVIQPEAPATEAGQEEGNAAE